MPDMAPSVSQRRVLNTKRKREATERWKQEHPERYQAAIKKWKQGHPEKVREQNRRAQATWRAKQKARKNEALRQEWAQRDGGSQEKEGDN